MNRKEVLESKSQEAQDGFLVLSFMRLNSRRSASASSTFVDATMELFLFSRVYGKAGVGAGSAAAVVCPQGTADHSQR